LKVKVLDKGLDGFTGKAWLLKRGPQHYVASHTYVPFSGRETLVFRSDAQGKVSSFLEVCGGKAIGLTAAVRELEGMNETEIKDA
jgi:hypothetical protein